MNGLLRSGLAVLLLASGLVGCGGSAEEPADEVVFDELRVLEDGAGYAVKLDPGTYKVEMTASDDGASVTFVGSPCPGSEGAQQTFSSICEMAQTGQVSFDNPTSVEAGASSSVTIKITKLAR